MNWALDGYDLDCEACFSGSKKLDATCVFVHGFAGSHKTQRGVDAAMPGVRFQIGWSMRSQPG